MRIPKTPYWIALIAMLFVSFPVLSQVTKSARQEKVDYVPKLEHGTAVQIKSGFWLFQMKPRNNHHILIYIQEALDDKGERIGWTTTQLAGEFGNSVDLLPKYVKGEDFPHKREFAETLALAHLFEFMLDGKIATSFWEGDFILIAGEPDIDMETP